MRSQSSGLAAVDVIRALARHWKKAFAIFCLILTATVCWIIFVPKEYESIAKVYVRVGRENNTLDPSATTGQTVNIQQTLEAEINSMLQIIESRETASLVLQDIGIETILENDLAESSSGAVSGTSGESLIEKVKDWLDSVKSKLLPKRFPETRESLALQALQKQSKFWSPKKSNVIHLSYRAGHPKLAQQVVQAWTEAFIEENLRVTRTEGSLYFFVKQTEEIQNRLLETEDELKTAKSDSGLVSIEGQRLVLENQGDSIRTRAMANATALEASKAKLKELKTIFEKLPSQVDLDQTTAESHQGWNTLREKLFELQIREHELKSKYSSENPEVIAVVRQREEVEKILATQSRSAPELVKGANPTYQVFQQALLTEQASLISLMAEKTSLNNQLRQNLADVKKLNENSVKIADLERRLQILDLSYRESAARLEQARILEAMETANISSVSKLQHASYSAQPAGLGRLKTLLLGGFLATGCALGIAFFAEYFDRSFVTVSQVEQSLELPVLATIPQGRRQFMEVR